MYEKCLVLILKNVWKEFGNRIQLFHCACEVITTHTILHRLEKSLARK